MTPDEIKERNGKRMLAAVYRLAKGSTENAVATADVLAEVRREALFEITDAQFDAYLAKVRSEVDAHRAALALGHCHVCVSAPATVTYAGVPHCNRCAP